MVSIRFHTLHRHLNQSFIVCFFVSQHSCFLLMVEANELFNKYFLLKLRSCCQGPGRLKQWSEKGGREVQDRDHLFLVAAQVLQDHMGQLNYRQLQNDLYCRGSSWLEIPSEAPRASIFGAVCSLQLFGKLFKWMQTSNRRYCGWRPQHIVGGGYGQEVIGTKQSRVNKLQGARIPPWTLYQLLSPGTCLA